MKRALLLTVVVAGTALLAGQGIGAEVESLRGGVDLGALGEATRAPKQVVEEGGFERAYEEQPPLIPHKIDKDRIDLKNNSCLKCHSKENFEKEDAPEVGESHYVDAQGNQLDTISMRRYFCDQCHVPQLDVRPLVENTFTSK